MAVSINTYLHDRLDETINNYYDTIAIMKNAMEEQLEQYKNIEKIEITDEISLSIIKVYKTDTDTLLKKYKKELKKLQEKRRVTKIEKFISKFTQEFPEYIQSIFSFTYIEVSENEVPLYLEMCSIMDDTLTSISSILKELKNLNDDLLKNKPRRL